MHLISQGMVTVVKIKNRVSGLVATAVLATFTLPLTARQGIESGSLILTAQQGIESGSRPVRSEDSLRCLDNTLRFTVSYENRDLVNATGYWRQVARECPAASEDLYIKGETMYTELYEVTGRREYIDTVLLTLSQRTLWFGNKPANDLQKSSVLFKYGENDILYTGQCYTLIKNVADSFPDFIGNSWSVRLMEAAVNAYTLSIIDTTEVLAAYTTAMKTVETASEMTTGESPGTGAAERIELLFRNSDAMTCSSIEKIYSPQVDKNIRNTVLIDKVFTLLEETGCTGSGFYYRIAARMYADKKSAENAVRLAELNYSRNNTDKALWYFTEAYKIDTSKTVRSDVLTRIASMELEAGKRQDARNHGETAYELNNKNGKAIFIIAEAYAGSKVGDAFDNHAAYWVAVDYLKTAKTVDPSLKEAADEKIKEYSALFPTREEGYYRGMTDEGVVYRVGGWIGEVTKVRFRKE